MTFGERVTQLREQRELSKNKLALMAGMGRPHLHEIERGRIKSPTSDVVRRLADALGVPVEELLGTAVRADSARSESLGAVPPAIVEGLQRVRVEVSDQRYQQLVKALTAVIDLALADA